jgi:ADP-heptose:LPS heptosyltransferase
LEALPDMTRTMTKLLIVRFSSFGDIVQALPAVSAIKNTYPTTEIHWLIRSDFRGLVDTNPGISRVWSFDRKSGLRGLIELGRTLQEEKFSHIYDAHNNVRSRLLIHLIRLFCIFSLSSMPHCLVRPKNRWKRFLFFKFRLKVLPQPFRGSLSFLSPLTTWNISPEMPPAPQFFINEKSPMDLPSRFIALVPSAAWPNKRWPVEYWKKLVPLLAPMKLVILGGPEDDFCQEIADVDPSRVINLAGKLSLAQSCAVTKAAVLTISADTGLLHAADQLGAVNIGLIGPTAFGYTSQPQSTILETHLYCKPCSKDGRTPCINPIYQKCMKDILPEFVAQKSFELLHGKSGPPG